MSTSLLSPLFLGLTALVVAGLSVMLWRERRSATDGRVALLSGTVLTLWAVVATALAYRGSFQPRAAETVPPVGVTLGIVLAVLFVSLTASVSLRGLLTSQADLIRLHLWRLVGIVFLVLMVRGEAPALWALPAGIGDILIAITAPWIARHVDTPYGRRRAVLWNLLGMADLILAIGLGTMLSPGATQIFETIPTTEVMTRFPLALVPTFLVPLAFTLHVVSLWQLLGVRWAPHAAAANAVSR